MREEQYPNASKPSAEASVGKKATGKSSRGRKAKQISKAELKDMEQRQRALEKQLSIAEKQAELEKLSNSNKPSVSRPFLPEQLAHSSQAWSPEGASELSPTPAFLDSRE